MCTIIKSSYFEEQNYLAIMENYTILELKDFDEKVINKLVGHIEKIQEITGYGDDFSSKLQVEEEKESLRFIKSKTGSSNIILITLVLVAILSLATIIIILLKNI